MIFVDTPIVGVVLIEADPRTDERGAFVRTFAASAFAVAGLCPQVLECSISTNRLAGTLRGLHLQRPPYAEAKLVRCTRGRIWDVAVDLRRGSPSLGRWFGTELSASSLQSVYIPEGCAHGFVTLEDDSDVLYQMSAPHRPDAAAGVRWDDPTFGITWPRIPHLINNRDAEYPDFDPARDLV